MWLELRLRLRLGLGKSMGMRRLELELLLNVLFPIFKPIISLADFVYKGMGQV